MVVTGFCAGCAGRRGLLVSGVLSLVGCLSLLLPALYALVLDTGWLWFREWLNGWLVRNHWDVSVTQWVWQWLDWLDTHHQFMLACLVLVSSLHLLSTLTLILGTMLARRALLLPWIITDLIIIIIMVGIFISWTFLSFFVDLLIAIVFPVMAGLLLGLWIVLWRNAWRFFRAGSLGDTKLLQEVEDTSEIASAIQQRDQRGRSR